MNRSAGILLHISSLPSQYGIGCLDQAAYDFADWLNRAGQRWWQILPIGPTGYGDSPYQSFSCFAGNPYFISLTALMEAGELSARECETVDFGNQPDRVDYGKVYKERYLLLRKAFEKSSVMRQAAYREFEEENCWWLEDYALFMAIKGKFQGKPWWEWPHALASRDSQALKTCSEALTDEVGFQKYMQFRFFEQFQALKAFANEMGLGIIGDIPIYAAMDSADVWAQKHLFELDEQHRPIEVAGCPPDGFSADGQRWGNPLYRWKVHRDSGYAWWISRLGYCQKLYDMVRIDHFRGFDEYYAIPDEAQSASEGQWKKGPGEELFRAAKEQLGESAVLAEDLGYVTDSVRELLKNTGFAGMKVLEFAFDARDTGTAGDYLPHNYPEHCVAYTGTHDNETLTGWLDSITEAERRAVRNYLMDQYTPQQLLYQSLIALVMRSRAEICMIPMQDYLGLDNCARMNRPSVEAGNWRWRLTGQELTEKLCREIYEMTRRFGRTD